MFLPMRRFKHQISDAECKEILKNEKLGVQGTLEVVSKKFGLGSYSLL